MRRFLATLVLLAAISGCANVGPFAAQPGPATSPAATLLAMPDVIGQNAAVAEDKLRTVGFTNIVFGTVDGRMMVILPQNWTVKTQSAQPNELVAANEKIVLGCERNGGKGLLSGLTG